MLFNQVVLVSLAAGALAAPTPSFGRPVIHEKRSGLVKHKRGNRVNEDAVIPIRIGLKQSNIEHGYDFVMDIAHPSSANYGSKWSVEDVNKAFAPAEETRQAVRDWLLASGLSDEDIAESSNKAWIGFDVPANQAEKLFNTEYYEHEDSSDGSLRLGCDRIHLPEHVAPHVDYIRPGISFSPPLKKKTVENTYRHRRRGGAIKPRTPIAYPGSSHFRRQSNGTGLENCGTAITPACIRALYSIPSAYSDISSSDALGIYESGDVYDQVDLDLFFSSYAPNVPQGTHPTAYLIDGATAPVSETDPAVQGESEVDFDLAYSLIYPQTVVLYQTNTNTLTGSGANEEYTLMTDFLDAVDGSFCTSLDQSDGLQCGVANLTPVISISYSAGELYYTEAAVQRSCNEFMKLSLQGHTFVASSGDYGVAGHPPEADSIGCVDRTNLNSTSTTDGTVFNPQFPASCPYVLSVGATQLNSGQTVDDTEVAMLAPSSVGVTSGGATFSTSGGFSNYEPLPGYQQSAVSSYLSNNDPGYAYYTYSGPGSIENSNGIYNRNGRGIPDVSANGANLQTYIKGQSQVEYGTSLSTPIWASMLTLVNEQRTSQGKGCVGFVNAVLYENTQIFHDVTSGNNPGCNTDGFYAATGWDPLTGLGTPDYPTLLDVFLSLP